ncbi:MAG: 4Fe-4S binding protein [Muribaculaceae bacterium]|nr:4Fe-4S binding protein [Muribaculaceae bacterium]
MTKFADMYRSARIIRIIISLIAMGVPTWALLAGYDSVFVRMQILTSMLSGVAVCLIFWAVVTLIYGRIYCSTVCPLGTLMDCVGATARMVARRRKTFRYAAPSRRTRIVFLLITFVTLLSGVSLATTLLDPYSAYARMVEELVARPLGLAAPAVRFAVSTLAVAAATAAIVVAVASRHGRLLCNTVCPVGIILGYGARRSYFHIEIDPDRCINCGECERVCKAQCVKIPEKTVDSARCVVCFDCTAVCPNSAISYKTGRYRLGMPLMQSLDTSGSASMSKTQSSAQHLNRISHLK